MPAPASRALRPALRTGSVLAGRYRLHTPQPPAPGDPPQVERWRAEDVVLARPVDVLVLLAGGRRSGWGRELLEAAAAAGTLADPALARVYDAAVEQVPAERYGRANGTVDIAYVVSEHIPGAPLADVLTEHGPLRADDAVDLVLGAAEGLAVAHHCQVLHGAITPAVAVLSDSGGLRLRDTAVAGVLTRHADDGAAAATPADDVRALAGCLYALLTGYWPAVAGPQGAGLPAAPVTGGRPGSLCSPRQVRAGVPRAVDDAVMAVLGPRPGPPGEGPTAQEFARRLREAATSEAASRLPAPPARRLPRLPPALARRLPVALLALLLVGVGVTAYRQGRSLGTVQKDRNDLQALVEATPSATPGAPPGAGTRLNLSAPGVRVTAFDPPPGDGHEDDAAVGNAVDGDPATAWSTEMYATESFGGLKRGVGLLVDLGAPTSVARVELGVSPGVDLELHAGDAAPTDIAALPTVASVANAPAVTSLTPARPVVARYLVVWLTRLPRDGGSFRGSISEMFVVRG